MKKMLYVSLDVYLYFKFLSYAGARKLKPTIIVSNCIKDCVASLNLSLTNHKSSQEIIKEIEEAPDPRKKADEEIDLNLDGKLSEETVVAPMPASDVPEVGDEFDLEI